MAKHVLYIRMEKYLRQWILHKYGEEPITFPKWSKETDFLQDHLQRKPKHWKPVHDESCIAILGPRREGFYPSTWCYIPYYHLVKLRQMLTSKFLREFFEFLATPNPDLPTYKSRIIEFMARNGIEDDTTNLETLMKIRIRKGHLFEKPTDINVKANKAHKGTTKSKKM